MSWVESPLFPSSAPWTPWSQGNGRAHYGETDPSTEPKSRRAEGFHYKAVVAAFADIDTGFVIRAVSIPPPSAPLVVRQDALWVTVWVTWQEISGHDRRYCVNWVKSIGVLVRCWGLLQVCWLKTAKSTWSKWINGLLGRREKKIAFVCLLVHVCLHDCTLQYLNRFSSLQENWQPFSHVGHVRNIIWLNRHCFPTDLEAEVGRSCSSRHISRFESKRSSTQLTFTILRRFSEAYFPFGLNSGCPQVSNINHKLL